MKVITSWEAGQKAMEAIGIDDDTSRWTTTHGLSRKTTYYRNMEVLAVETLTGSFQNELTYELKIYS